MVRAPGCGPGDRGFEPHHPPHFSPATRCERALGRGQAVRHETLTLAFAGSTPAAPAMFDPLAQLAEHLTFNQGVRSSNLRWVTMKNRSFLMMRDERFCFMRAWNLHIRLRFCKSHFLHFHFRPKRAQDGRKDRLPGRNLRGSFRRALSCRLFVLCKFCGRVLRSMPFPMLYALVIHAQFMQSGSVAVPEHVRVQVAYACRFSYGPPLH